MQLDLDLLSSNSSFYKVFDLILKAGLIGDMKYLFLNLFQILRECGKNTEKMTWCQIKTDMDM